MDKIIDDILIKEKIDLSVVLESLYSLDDTCSNLSEEKLIKLLDCVRGLNCEEEFWDYILMNIDSNMIPEELFNYLIINEMALVSLCHMDHSNERLVKLMKYDDAPIYKLSERYFVSNDYSDKDFILFYNKCLFDREDVSLFLLEFFSSSSKWDLLIYLCYENRRFVNKKILEEYSVAKKIRSETSTDTIMRIYEKYQESSVVLLNLSKNLFSPNSILNKLSTVKLVKNAKEIRKNSLFTLHIKSMIDKCE